MDHFRPKMVFWFIIYEDKLGMEISLQRSEASHVFYR